MAFSSRRMRAALGLAVALGSVSVAALGAVPAVSAPARPADPSTSTINGSGSSWAAIAVNEWTAAVRQQGLSVNYNPDGSAAGRLDFAYGTSDFADSDIGYQGTDPLTGAIDTSLGRNYAYVPVVAGGTSFPYHLTVAGALVQNLRLSGATLAGIFTDKITNWDDPAITKDNNGRAFPSIPIIPVVHSEGSGDTAQLSQYLATEFPTQWTAFAGKDVFTEYWPRQGQQVAENGSDGVINFITSAAANGSIGYDEYAYPEQSSYPVAKIENTAGYFTLPSQYNVAVALTQAQINMTPGADYLLQTLNNVYVYNDPRTYPLSSYSYGIIPTSSTDSHMTTAKRQTMADFFDYAVCQGQSAIGAIGYSSLPINLVEAAFDQVDDLHTADAGVQISQNTVSACHNPTFIAGQPDKNYLAEVAPEPPLCDRTGEGPCTSANSGTGPATSTLKTTTTTTKATGTSTTTGQSTTSTGTSTSTKTDASTAPSASSSAGVATGGNSGGTSTGQAGDNTDTTTTAAIEVTPTSLSAGASNTTLEAVLAVILILAVIIAPSTLIGLRRSRRKES